MLDGELATSAVEEIRSHVQSCERCRSLVSALEGASVETATALRLLDVEPDLSAAKVSVRSKGEERPASDSFFHTWSLPKAASIALLLTGAAVTALPGSPVRRWMAEGWQALTGSSELADHERNPDAISEDPTISLPDQATPETGAGISASAEAVEIWIHGLSQEADLRVLWTDGEEAWVYAGEGTRYTSTASRLEAFDPPGTVRVEIPRTVRRVVLGLDGEILLRKSGGELEILGPVQERSPSEIRFEPGPGSNGGATQGVSNP
jgi:hypothetical protein